MLNITSKDRIAIYFFYNKFGIANRYVMKFLDGLKEIADKIFVVVNGTLTKESESEIRKYAYDILYRENVGLDAWAYKEAFDYIGWDKLREYKEVVYCNATVFGPVYPFSEMFNKMAEKENLDFWGISFHPDLKIDDKLYPLGYIPEHIQHYFVVYRQKFTKAPELKEYWDNLQIINNYEETVAIHETRFTKYFADKGFKWDVYVRYTFDEEDSKYLLMFEPLKAIQKYRCPVIKRKLFFLPQYHVLPDSIGERTNDLLDYLQDNKLYNTDLIYESIIRTTDQPYFINNFNFRYVLSEKVCSKHFINDGSVACIVLGKKLNLDDRNKFNRKTSFYTLDETKTNSADLIKLIIELSFKYKFICIYNNNSIKDDLYYTRAHSYIDTQRRSICASRTFVKNVINTFNENKYLGMLSPMYPITIDKKQLWCDIWQGSYDRIEEILTKLNVNVLIKKEYQPAASISMCLWLKSSSISKYLPDLEKLSDKVSLNDFMLILPFIVQGNGYAPGFLTTDRLAGKQFAALTYYVESMLDPEGHLGIVDQPREKPNK